MLPVVPVIWPFAREECTLDEEESEATMRATKSHTRDKSHAPEVMPTLSAGRHRTARQGACFMEFASYLAGETWSDHPACTHPLVAAIARDVNDLTTDSARAGLTPLITRVIGLSSNAPIVSATIALRAAAAALPVASMDRQRALAAGVICMIACFDSRQLDTLATAALASAPDAAQWARTYLAATGLVPRSFNRRAAEAMVHTATVGIALACIDDADARLCALLETAITATEQFVRPVTQRGIPAAGLLQPV